MRLRNSFWAGLTGSVDFEVTNALLDKIRCAMLESASGMEPDAFMRLDMEITFAQDINALWELRPQLLAALTKLHGEDLALAKIRQITELFVGHHPAAKSGNFFRR